jgi:hypothetical protein
MVTMATLDGDRCTACGWIRSTPRFTLFAKAAKRDAREAFQAHGCSNHPLPRASRTPDITDAAWLPEFFKKLLECSPG